jgi:hypothetical protein
LWLACGAFALIVSAATLRALAHPVWDDALFFQRFGFNIVHSGVAAWNVADGPVHGSTSQLYQLIAAGIVAIAPGHYQLAIRLWLAACLFAGFVLTTRMIPRERAPITLLFCGFCAPTLLLLIESGMETLLALDAVALALLVIEWARSERFGSPVRELCAFVASELLVYLARPDLMLISATASLALVDWRAGPLRQRRYLRLLVGLGVGLAVLWSAFHAYYGSALPLSFYVKNRALTHYDADYKQLDVPGTRRQLATWLLIAGPFLYVALLRVRARAAWLLASSLALLVYQSVFTLQIMGYHTRFFIPALLPVLLAACAAWPDFSEPAGYARRALPVLIGWPALGWFALRHQLVEAPGVDDPVSWISAGEYALYGVPTLCLFAVPLLSAGLQRYAMGALPALALAICAGLPRHRPDTLDDEAIEQATAVGWPGLSEVKRCIRQPTHMYQSELGLPGVMFLRSRITDLSGLMNPGIAFGHADFDSDCLRDPPEVLFLPHRTHRHLNERIANGRCIQRFARVDDVPASSTPLYIRRDLLPGFQRCLHAAE